MIGDDRRYCSENSRGLYALEQQSGCRWGRLQEEEREVGLGSAGVKVDPQIPNTSKLAFRWQHWLLRSWLTLQGRVQTRTVGCICTLH